MDERVVVRPHFGQRQVRSLKGIKARGVYWLCSKVARHLRMEIIGKPYQKGKIWTVSCRVWGNGEPYQEELPLCDWNVVPYEDGLWNPTNWLERR